MIDTTNYADGSVDIEFSCDDCDYVQDYSGDDFQDAVNSAKNDGRKVFKGKFDMERNHRCPNCTTGDSLM